MTGIKISHSLAFLDDFVGNMIEIYKKKNPTVMCEAITCLEDIRKILRAIGQGKKLIKKTTTLMTLNEYQEKAMTTCTPSSRNFSYMMLNLVGEVGEFASKVAKAIRKEDAVEISGQLRTPLNEALKAEAGDILWQLSGLCNVMGWNLEDVAQMNLDKLQSRQQRGVIIGEGDNR